MSDANARQVGGDHYRAKPVQVWDFITANGLGFLAGNVVKYVSRYKDKGGVTDLEKARHYLDKLIEVERANRKPDHCDHGVPLNKPCPSCMGSTRRE